MQVILSKDASKKVQGYFKRKGLDLILFEGDGPYHAVKNHPDMHLFLDDILYGDKDYGYNKVLEALGDKYPETVKYNIAKVGGFIFCKEDVVPNSLLKQLKSKYQVIPVKQGYAKCSIGIIDHRSIITADKGIHTAAIKHDLDSLLIGPGHIQLEGLEYGFIGGTLVGLNDEIFFSGDVRLHPDYHRIRDFIESRKLKLVYTDEPLTDLGSFILLGES